MGHQCGFPAVLALICILTTTQVACRHSTQARPEPTASPVPTGPHEGVDPIVQASFAASKARRLQELQQVILSALGMNESDVVRANEAVQRSKDRGVWTELVRIALEERNRTTAKSFPPVFRPEEVMIFPTSLPASLQFPKKPHNMLYFDITTALSRFSSPRIETSSVNVFVVAGSEYEASAALSLGVYDQTFTPPRTSYRLPLSGHHFAHISTTWMLKQNLIGLAKSINVTESGQWIKFELGRQPQRWLQNPQDNLGLAFYNGTLPQAIWIGLVIPGLHRDPYLHLKLSVQADPSR